MLPWEPFKRTIGSPSRTKWGVLCDDVRAIPKSSLNSNNRTARNAVMTNGKDLYTSPAIKDTPFRGAKAFSCPVRKALTGRS
jgi:hypothetical protein